MSILHAAAAGVAAVTLKGKLREHALKEFGL